MSHAFLFALLIRQQKVTWSMLVRQIGPINKVAKSTDMPPVGSGVTWSRLVTHHRPI